MSTNSNQSAFPLTGDCYKGLTKREYFAAMAMQGLCVDPNMSISSVAPVAVQIADSLLSELEKTDPK